MPASSRLARAYAGWGLVLLLAAAIAALALGPAAAVEGEGDDALSDPVAFAETSYANVCAECHGSDGDGAIVPGTDRRAPALAGRDEVDAAYVDLVLRTGRMPPAGDPFDNRAREVVYSEAEREALVDYLVQEFALEPNVPEVEEGDVAEGLQVFALHCAHCHGNAGAGGTAGQRAWTPQVNHLEEVAVAEAIRVGPFEMPAFSEDVISDDDIDDITTYLEAVDAEEGTPVLGIVELNPVFASAFVGLLAVSLLGGLLYIGSRPQPFERVDGAAIPGDVDDPGGRQTPMPGDPAYEAAIAPQEPEGRDTRHEPVPYLDEGDGAPTSGETERPQAGDADPTPAQEDDR